MSAKVGMRRLLVTLSVIYWIAAAIFTFYASADVVNQCDGSNPSNSLFYACRDEMLPAAGTFIGLALVLFGLIWAIYFTVRWIIRGFQKPA